MYIPPHFSESRPQILHDLIDQHPLGILITHADGLDANHIPFHLIRDQGPHGSLTCHVARANPVWQQLATGDEVLVVFRAAEAYVSPNWYPSKHETHRQVPTWNYSVVHAQGRVTLREDERFLRHNLAFLTKRHEGAQPVPWKMGDAPRDYLEAMLKAIVGLEIQITRLEGKFKLSQNKDIRDIRSAGQALCDQGDSAIGAAMIAVAAGKAQEAD